MLEGKVAIVTGAGRGLGRVEALELARLGARVVVNDLGVTSDGSGRAEEPGREVVDEIRQAGGEAVAHFGDVADWNDAQALIGRAIEEFGDLNILVNNAGYCRDRMIFNMAEDDFDGVVRVHLKGHFCTMRFATAYWRDRAKQNGQPVYGRLISTSSEAFIFGSAGQPNYAAAKAGIVAMTMGAAQALHKYGVLANVILPRARTAMTDQGITGEMFAKPSDGFDTFGPENVAPLVGYLASPAAEKVSGYVMLVYGKTVTVLERPALGESFDNDDMWTVEDLSTKLGPYFEAREPVTDGFSVPPA